MAHATGKKWWLGGLAAAVGLVALVYLGGKPRDPQETPRRIQSQLADMRGLPFKHEVIVQIQSQEEFAKSIRAETQRLRRTGDYEKVTRMLGLLASDETLNITEVEKQATTIKPANSHYDPDSGRVLLVKGSSAEAPGLLYARELYRALLDQHFDLQRYSPRLSPGSALNGDERLAREMVVAGEVLYASVMWSMQFQNGRKPTEDLLSAFVSKLNEQDRMALLGTLPGLSDPRFRPAHEKIRPARKEPGEAPFFLSEMARGVERDGINFVHTVHYNGWSEVEKLYKESPPASTEQVLHPEKWRAGERPVNIQWPDLKTNELFKDWELLAQDVLGEFQWRIVFRAHGFSPLMGAVPRGWNGDRYAVFKRRGGEDSLMLMHTAWDTEADAKGFASAYRVLVPEKYAPDAPPPTHILQKGLKVTIVEGGSESSLASFMRFAESAQEIDGPE